MGSSWKSAPNTSGSCLTSQVTAGRGLKNIQNADGSLVFGQLAGQLTPQAAMGQLLHQVSLVSGDRP
jgi:hypothetical protein